GIGLRGPHLSELLQRRPALDFVEVHAENYMDFGPAFDRLLDVRRNYAVSLHGVGLSLGSAGGIDADHLARFRDLIDRVDPLLVSEHLAWSVVNGVYLNDLLPLPYTEEALDAVAGNVTRAQEALGRRLLVENPSRYLSFVDSTIPEAEFLRELVTRTGCAILCDVNNIFVNAHNVGEEALVYLEKLPREAVHEIHLAGHSVQMIGGRTVLIDDHGSPVCDDVWDLYALAVRCFGAVPCLIERDRNLPPLDDLLAEAGRARAGHVVGA
ncbi:MAG: hypothetical protein K0Q70_2680, partial [Rhodospirillales bacterium]|nr:hypothetical protein [Rhodospirillales bacterium]